MTKAPTVTGPNAFARNETGSSSHDNARRSRPSVSGIGIYETATVLADHRPRSGALHELVIQAT